jgi:hypothetical protein
MINSTDLVVALDYSRFDALDEHAELRSSYWTSVREAALRCKRLTVEVHCRQIAAVTREAFGIARMLGAASDKARCSA